MFHSLCSYIIADEQYVKQALPSQPFDFIVNVRKIFFVKTFSNIKRGVPEVQGLRKLLIGEFIEKFHCNSGSD